MTNEEIRRKAMPFPNRHGGGYEYSEEFTDKIQTMSRNDTLDELLKYEPSGLADKDAWYVVGFKDCLEQFKSKIEGMKL